MKGEGWRFSPVDLIMETLDGDGWQWRWYIFTPPVGKLKSSGALRRFTNSTYSLPLDIWRLGDAFRRVGLYEWTVLPITAIGILREARASRRK